MEISDDSFDLSRDRSLGLGATKSTSDSFAWGKSLMKKENYSYHNEGIVAADVQRGSTNSTVEHDVVIPRLKEACQLANGEKRLTFYRVCEVLQLLSIPFLSQGHRRCSRAQLQSVLLRGSWKRR